MNFAWPLGLLALILVPLAIGAYLLIQRRRTRYAVRFTNLDLLADVASDSPGWRRHVPFLLYLVALVALAFALARPQIVVSEPREQATIILAMDVSRSMEATDVEPSRLAAAKDAARMFVDQLPEKFRVGVIGFSTTADILARPTTDRREVMDAVDALRPLSGTAMGDGIVRALEVSGRVAPGPDPTQTPVPRSGGKTAPVVVLLLSDGANTTGTASPDQAAALARRAAVPVFTVALGTASGVVQIPDGFGGERPLPVPPDPATLRTVARTTNGRFFAAPNADDLRTVYERLGSRLGYDEHKTEITVAFAGAALVLLLVGGGLAAAWFNRFP